MESLTFVKSLASSIRTLETNLTLAETKARAARAEQELEAVKRSLSQLEATVMARDAKISELTYELGGQILRAENAEKTLEEVRAREAKKLWNSNFVGFNVGCEFAFC
ncbi:hypothetical protein Droror1_Dr00025188 [Drosera rotundifolia]